MPESARLGPDETAESAQTKPPSGRTQNETAPWAIAMEAPNPSLYAPNPMRVRTITDACTHHSPMHVRTITDAPFTDAACAPNRMQ